MLALLFALVSVCGVQALNSPRTVAYVNCLCGFGYAKDGTDSCLTNPDPNQNYMLQWEQLGTCPITHYILVITLLLFIHLSS